MMTDDELLWKRHYEQGFREGYAAGRESVRLEANPERLRMVEAMVRLRDQGKTWRGIGDVFGMSTAGARNAAFGTWIAKDALRRPGAGEDDVEEERPG